MSARSLLERLRSGRWGSMSLVGLVVSVCVLALPVVAAGASVPRIATDGASATSSGTARVSGSGDPNGLSTTVRAYYAPAGEQWCASHGAEGTHAETGPQELGSGNVEISEILVELSGLDPSSEYCTELVAENADGTAYGGQVSFTTPTPPSIESESVSHVTTTDATLEATIDPLGRETTYVFYLEAPSCREDGPGACEASGGRPIYEGKIPAGPSGVTVSVDLGRLARTLSSGTFYGYRVTATNTTDGVEATSYGQLKTFITDGPRVSRLQPDSGPVSGGTRLTIFGNILENTRSGSVYFGSVKGRIVEEECDGMCEIVPYTTLVVESPPHEAGTVNVTVENEQGYVSTINPGDQFTYVSSSGAPPSEVVTGSAEATPTGYKLKGKLNPDGLPTTYYYKYASDTCDEGCTPMKTAVVGPLTGVAQQEAPGVEVTGLTAGQYWYILVATNEDGTVEGAPVNFKVATTGEQTKQEPTSEPPLFPGPPLIAVSPLVETASRTGPLTRGQKLADALRACERKPKKWRASCERQAHEKYRAATKAIGKQASKRA
jgi:hypothetical protein